MRFPWPFRRRSSPVAPVLVDPWQQVHGTGQDWVPSTYGDYIATNATLYSCVMLRARNLARVTLRIHTTAGEARGAGVLARGPARNPRSVPVPPSHPAQALFDNVNPHWTCRSFWYQVEASLCLWGSAPIAIFHDGAGTPAELWWLNPHRFRAVPHKTDYIQGYIYEKDGREIAFEPHEVMWLRYPNPIDEYAALSPLAALRMTVDMNTDAVAFNRRFFQNDGTPGRVYIKTEATLTRAEATALRARWEEAFKGPNKSHRIAVLDKSADLASLGVSQKDMDFTEGQRFTKEEIAGAFGVPPMLIGDLRHATLNNFRVAKTSFWDETMVPELELVEGFINHVLTPQLGSGLTANFDLSEIAALREDQSEKAKRQKLLTESGIMTINELRAQDGLPAVLWGDEPPPTFTRPAFELNGTSSDASSVPSEEE